VGFSLRGLVLARPKTRRLKPAPRVAQAFLPVRVLRLIKLLMLLNFRKAHRQECLCYGCAAPLLRQRISGQARIASAMAMTA